MQSDQMQHPPPQSSRLLKPSQLQQARAPSSPRSSGRPPPIKPKPAASTPSSVLTRDRLQSNLKYYQFLTRVQHLLIESASVSSSSLQRALLVLRPVDYEEVTQERSNDGKCGWPSCGNEVQRGKAEGRYRLSLRQQRVWEVDGLQRYCSEKCEDASAEYAVELKEEPLYMRRLGDMMAAMQQGEQRQQQQTAQELLASLPVSTAPHSADILRGALPPNADTSGLVIKENNDDIVKPDLSGSSAGIEGHSQQQHQQQPTKLRQAQLHSPMSSSAHRVGKIGAASTSLRTPSHQLPARDTATAEASPRQPDQPPAVRDVEYEDELLEAIAQTAISEKAKLKQQLNRLSDSSSPTTAGSLSDSDDSDIHSVDEARQNFAQMRLAKPLSSFAQLAGLLTHYVTDDTAALLRGGSTQITPASTELVRRRQEALLKWLHGELKVVCAELGVRHTRDVVDSVDAVALTFLLNEAVPSLPSHLWQLLVTVVLLALQRCSRVGATFDIDKQGASSLVRSRGFSDVQLAALMDIILPPAAITHPSSATLTPQLVTTNPAAATPATDAPSPVLNTTGASLLSVPRYILSSALSCLDSSDLLSASLVCSLFRLLCHPLRQHSDERTLLAHSQSLTATRMHTIGYREGVQESRELLMQAGFDAGIEEGWRGGRAAEWKKGVVGALSMWSEEQASPATSTDVGWSAADADWLWQQCERINSAVMRRPRERGGRVAISVTAAADEEATTGHGGETCDERCVHLLAQLSVDGRRLFDRLAADMEDWKDARLPSEQRALSEEFEVDARIAAALSGSVDGIGGDSRTPNGRATPITRTSEAEEAATDNFM